MKDENQIILVDKPAGISSFGVVAKVRGFLRNEFGHKVKVGHTGTLDPFATGLLILLSGKMTKKSGEFLKLDKEYVATLKLGYVSSTGDTEGEITRYKDETVGTVFLRGSAGYDRGLAREPRDDGRERRAPKKDRVTISNLNINDVQTSLDSFIDTISQTVPKFSAVKINGQRAYKLARKGEDFETPTRQVQIYGIQVLRYEYPELVIRCQVSSGTYIRTLAEDIGKKLGTGAYLTALRRTKVGDFSVENAKKLEDFEAVPTQRS